MSIATQDYSYMDDSALQQALQFAQRSNDTMKFLGIKAELDKRAQTRTAAQGQQAGQQMSQQPPQTIADKVASGVANLPINNPGYAHGGIVAFAEAGRVKDTYETPYDRLVRETREQEAAAPKDTGLSWWEKLGEGLNALGGGPTSYRPSKREIPALTLQNMSELTSGNASTVPKTTPKTDDGVTLQNIAQLVSGNAMTQPRMPVKAPPAPAADDGGISALIKSTTRSRTPAAAGPAPAATAINVENTDTPEQLAARREALAAKDNEGITAVYKRMADRDATRQAKLDSETQDKEGLLGFKMSPAVREALLQAGIGAMSSKSTTALGGIGEGLGAGAAAYKEGEKRRTSRQDLLDEASDKRTMAEIAAKQGNQDRAGQLMTQAAALKTQAQNWGVKKAEIGQKDAELALHAQIEREKMDNALKSAGITAGAHLAAAKLPTADVQITREMMKDPKFAETYSRLLDTRYGAKTPPTAEFDAWISKQGPQLQYAPIADQIAAFKQAQSALRPPKPVSVQGALP